MPVIPLDFWVKVSENLPWDGPIKRIYRNTLTELPTADPKVVLFTAVSAFAHGINGEIPEYMGGLAKISINLGIVGPSGTGKTSVPNHVFKKLGYSPAGARSSPEGLAKALAEGSECVQIADEVHQVFRGRKREDYVGALVDLWKTAFLKVPLKFLRRSSRKDIIVAPDSKLTVIWTTTPDDLEDVAMMFDAALIRRFLILYSEAKVDPLVKGGVADWDPVVGAVRFTSMYRWRFYPEIDESIMSFRDRFTAYFSDSNLVKMILSEYGLRIASVLALDRVVSALMKRVERQLRGNVFLTDEGYRQYLVTELSALIRSRPEAAGAPDEAPETSTDIRQPSAVSHKRGVGARVEGETISSTEKQVVQAVGNGVGTRNSYISLKYVEDIYISLLKIVVDMLKEAVEGDGLNEEHVKRFIELMSTHYFWRVPEVSSDDMHVVDVHVPREYVLLGVFLTALAVTDSRDVVRWLGYDPVWAYFIRRLHELGERFGELTVRDMAMYMYRIRHYRDLLDLIYKAKAAGYLEVVACEDRAELSRCRYRVRVGADAVG